MLWLACGKYSPEPGPGWVQVVAVKRADEPARIAASREAMGSWGIRELADGSGTSTVAMADVISRCITIGMPAKIVHTLMERLPVEWIAADIGLAHRAGETITLIKPFGLPLGDRFCLALALREKLPAFTAQPAWLEIAVPLGLQVKMIR